jgi:hypothetical protein
MTKIKTPLSTIEEIETAVMLGKSVHWRNDKNEVIKTTNSLKLKLYINKDKYSLTYLDRAINHYGVVDFYVIEDSL